MKNILILTLALLLSGFVSYGQDDLSTYSFNPQLKEMDRLMSKGQKNSFSIIIDGVSKKDIEKSWEKYIKDHDTKSKWNKKTKEYFADNAKIEEISDNTIDVYSQLVESGKRVELIVWMDLGGGFLSTYEHPEKAKHGEAFIIKFTTDMEKKRVDNFREQQEDKLDDLRDNLKDMKKDQGKMEEDIEDYQKKIEEARKKIEEIVAKQATKETEIKAQEDYLERVKEIKTGLENNN